MHIEQALILLLRDRLFAGELTAFRHWIESLPDSQEIVANLPAASASAAEVIAAAVHLLVNRGRVDRALFRHLLLARPAMRGPIGVVMRRWFGETSGAEESGRVARPGERADPQDLTDRLLGGVKTLELESDDPVAPARLFALGTGESLRWTIDRVFSPELHLRIGPGPELCAPEACHLSYLGARKARRIALDVGSTEVTLVQSQPSLRRATLSIVRGVSTGTAFLFELARVRFSVSNALPGRLIAIETSNVEIPPIILWFLEAS